MYARFGLILALLTFLVLNDGKKGNVTDLLSCGNFIFGETSLAKRIETYYHIL